MIKLKFNFEYEPIMHERSLNALKDSYCPPDGLKKCDEIFTHWIEWKCDEILRGDLRSDIFKNKYLMTIAIYGTGLGRLSPSDLCQISHFVIYNHYEKKRQRPSFHSLWDTLFHTCEAPEDVVITPPQKGPLNRWVFTATLPEGVSIFHPAIEAIHKREGDKLYLSSPKAESYHITYDPKFDSFLCLPNALPWGPSKGTSESFEMGQSFSSESATSSPARV
jgi:hypothetical protein